MNVGIQKKNKGIDHIKTGDRFDAFRMFLFEKQDVYAISKQGQDQYDIGGTKQIGKKVIEHSSQLAHVCHGE